MTPLTHLCRSSVWPGGQRDQEHGVVLHDQEEEYWKLLKRSLTRNASSFLTVALLKSSVFWKSSQTLPCEAKTRRSIHSRFPSVPSISITECMYRIDHDCEKHVVDGWCRIHSQVTLEEVTQPRHGSVHPWPLSLVLNWQKRSAVTKRLGALGWTSKSMDDVYSEIENCCRALSERLESSPYFFGNRPTELDALVFGHIFSLLTTPLPDNKAKNIVQNFGNLVKLCENIERDYFEKLNSSDSDNGNFVKLP